MGALALPVLLAEVASGLSFGPPAAVGRLRALRTRYALDDLTLLRQAA